MRLPSLFGKFAGREGMDLEPETLELGKAGRVQPGSSPEAQSAVHGRREFTGAETQRRGGASSRHGGQRIATVRRDGRVCRDVRS